MCIQWKGGQWPTQYLECRRDLLSSTEQWSAIYTNRPLPTPITNWVIDGGATNEALFYPDQSGSIGLVAEPYAHMTCDFRQNDA
jgi:hypothetical protein